MNKKRILSIFITGSLLLGSTGCNQKTKSDLPAASYPAAQTTLESDAATAPGLSAENTEKPDSGNEPLSVPRQLDVIATQSKKWGPSHKHFAVTDLNQDGRLELIASTGLQGRGRFTYSCFYQVDETGTALKKCKSDHKDGDLQEDLVDDLATAYYDQKTGEYHYITGDFATAGTATGFYSGISSITLRGNRMKSRLLAYHSREINRNKTTDIYRIVSKSGKEKELDADLFQREAIGDQAFSDCAKLSVGIGWFQFDDKPQKMTKQQILPFLEQSYQSFSLGYPLQQEKLDVHGYQVDVPQFTAMEDSRKQMRLNRLIRDAVADNLDTALYLSKDKKYNKENPFDLWTLSGQIKYAGTDRASILVEVEGMRKEAAHSAAWAYTINLDLVKEVTITQKDILPEEYRNTVEQLFQENICTVIRGREYRKHRLKKYNGTLLDEDDSWDNIEVYETTDSIGILINTAYAADSYAIFEVFKSNYLES